MKSTCPNIGKRRSTVIAWMLLFETRHHRKILHRGWQRAATRKLSRRSVRKPLGTHRKGWSQMRKQELCFVRFFSPGFGPGASYPQKDMGARKSEGARARRARATELFLAPFYCPVLRARALKIEKRGARKKAKNPPNIELYIERISH